MLGPRGRQPTTRQPPLRGLRLPGLHFIHGLQLRSQCERESDASCEFLSCVGCLNSLACNYDENATQVGSYIFPVPGLNCDGTCIDTDMDGVCDEDEVLGCTDETALNYDPAATEDAGNCVLPVGGCTDPSACNYDASANTNDGSCDFESCFGCLNELACNYDAGATYPDASQCDFETCYGCMDSMACNYDDTASFDDGSCDFVTCAGCTNAMACNYDETATIDDGSCDLATCYGCTDASLNAAGGFNACNYDGQPRLTMEVVNTCELPRQLILLRWKLCTGRGWRRRV